MANLVGQTLLDRYRVDELVGRGGMAEVYKVWDNDRSTYLALKLLRDDIAQDQVFLRRFRREAETLETLQHPNIVRFYGIEQTGTYTFMLMDFIEGASLRSEIFQLQGQAMAPSRVIDVMGAVCSALQFAHNRGFVHSDMKPANILVHRNEVIQVADFGIARMTDTATATMVGLGTPAYMAPEQIRGQDPTPQTDIYALGVVLFEMVTGGERPFTGERARTTGATSEKVRWEHLNLAAPSPKTHNSGLSTGMERVIVRCLEKDPRKRYPSALDLLNDLTAALAPEAREDETAVTVIEPPAAAPEYAPPQPPSTSVSASVSQPPRKSRRGFVWTIVAVVILGIGGAAVMFGPRLFTPAPPDFNTDLAIEQTIQAQIRMTGTATEALPTHTSAPTNTPLVPTLTPAEIVLGGNPLDWLPSQGFIPGGLDLALEGNFSNEDISEQFEDSQERLDYLNSVGRVTSGYRWYQLTDYCSVSDPVWLEVTLQTVLMVSNEAAWQYREDNMGDGGQEFDDLGGIGEDARTYTSADVDDCDPPRDVLDVTINFVRYNIYVIVYVRGYDGGLTLDELEDVAFQLARMIDQKLQDAAN